MALQRKGAHLITARWISWRPGGSSPSSTPFRTPMVPPLRVIQDSAGTLYGTTIQGGAFGRGTVYKLEANGKFTVLHAFTGSDGAFPSSGVIQDSAGALYGATHN